MPNLTVREGGREFVHQIERESVTVGRAPTNAIEIHDAKASKEHCRLERVGDRWKVVDLESKNGTRVNGDYRNKAWLDHGDTIQIGQTEIRFGLEGARRASRPPPIPSASVSASTRPRAGARVVAAPRTRAQRERAEELEYEDDLPPGPSRYAKDKTADRVLMIGGIVLAAIVVLVIVNNVAKPLLGDEYNIKVLETADRLMSQDRWDDALEYLQREGDPEGSYYIRVEEKIKQLQNQTPVFARERKNQLARVLLSRLSRKVKAYNAGKRSATASDILRLVQDLKTKYPGTESAELARKEFDVWWDGKVPQRAADLLASGGRLRRDWDEAVQKAREYEKKMHFREARETIERFVAARESVLEESELEYYREQRDSHLHRIDLLAGSYFTGRRRRADGLVKNKRYAQAIAVYREVIEKFGIDLYVRKAQLEIEKIEALKPKR